MPLEILPLGVGDTFSTKHNTTALLLRYEGEYLAIDCPDSYLKVLAEATQRSGWSTSPADVNRLLLTHLHGDHMNGLEGFGFYKHFFEQKRLALLTAPEVRSELWDARLKSSMGQLWTGTEHRMLTFEDYFDHQALPWQAETKVGPFTIRTRRTIHHIPTSAVMISAGAHTLGYSADTAFDPSLIEFLRPADLIIHETNYGPAHTAYEDLLTLDDEVKRKLRLIHYGDAFDPQASEIPVAEQGRVLVATSG